jgi:phospholipid/cholesterol/gamma-HCH transport system substrate-binding protein
VSRTPRPRSAIPASAYKVGVFAVVTLALLGLLATLIGNVSFVPERSFQADFTDATGVVPGDRVRLSGVEVGRVTSTELVERDGRQMARVAFTVEHGVPVYRSARLLLRYENIVGQRYLQIEEEPSSAEQMPAGGTFPPSQTAPALSLTVLFNGFQPLFRALQPSQVNRLSYLMIEALQGEGPTYQTLMSTTARLTNTVADRDAVIGRVVANLGSVLSTMNRRDRELTSLIVTFRRLMSGLAADRGAISTSLPGLADLLSVSTGLVREVRGPLAQDLHGLDGVAGALDRDRTTLDTSLNRMPRRMRALARTGSYGSNFNFYLCGISMNVRLLGESYILQTPHLAANERDTVCARGTDQ